MPCTKPGHVWLWFSKIRHLFLWIAIEAWLLCFSCPSTPVNELLRGHGLEESSYFLFSPTVPLSFSDPDTFFKSMERLCSYRSKDSCWLGARTGSSVQTKELTCWLVLIFVFCFGIYWSCMEGTKQTGSLPSLILALYHKLPKNKSSILGKVFCLKKSLLWSQGLAQTRVCLTSDIISQMGRWLMNHLQGYIQINLIQ